MEEPERPEEPPSVVICCKTGCYESVVWIKRNAVEGNPGYCERHAKLQLGFGGHEWEKVK